MNVQASQKSFNSGEWAPQLYARVDMDKFKSGAALLENFFVDYRGGASTRPGTRYVIQCKDSANPVRLIPFQASVEVGYVLEFGDLYIRFIHDGAPVLESTINITGITQANPAVVSAVNSYTNGDIVYITGVNGMTQVNGKYFKIAGRTAGTFQLQDLNGVNINSTGYGAWTSGGTAARVYTLVSPYAAEDLALLKFAQNVTDLIICHPDYVPYALTIISATNWVLAPISFGTTLTAPTGVATAYTGGAGVYNYSYVVTAVDANGQESAPSSASTIAIGNPLTVATNTVTITWNPVAGAASYNVYRTDPRISNPPPAGVPYGFIGNVTSTTMFETNIAADFSQAPPTSRNPFTPGASVTGVTITNQGSGYTAAPTVAFGAPGAGGVTAQGTVVMELSAVTSVAAGGAGYAIGDTITLTGNVILVVNNVAAGAVTNVGITNRGQITGALPSNPVAQVSTSGVGTGATFNLTWRVDSVIVTNGGTGYSVAPSVTFSAGAAAGTALLGDANAGNPSVPAFVQQRLCLAAPPNATQTIYLSQPASPYNFDVTFPTQGSDAITATLISGQLNNIRSLIPQPAGLVVISDGASWLVNGGSAGAPITPIDIVANPQSFVGGNDMPPIVANYDILYVQSRGTGVRDASYNFYANVYTGTDISILSSHLFFGYELTEWCWAEEPYKLVWAVRNDGAMLSLTFLKEQEFIAWAHSTTGYDVADEFKSVATVVEGVGEGYVNAVYVVVERTVNGNTVQYIERFDDRDFDTVDDAWTVDAGIQYSGSPATNFTGGEHLAGRACSGLADGVTIPEFTMPATGNFTLGTAASTVTVGIPVVPKLQTLILDIGEPTVQGQVKKISSVVTRVAQTLGLYIGGSFDTLVQMKDLVVGNVSSMLTGQDTQVVSDLVDGDAQTYIDPRWTTQGQYCYEARGCYPATILGVFPEVTTERPRQ